MQSQDFEQHAAGGRLRVTNSACVYEVPKTQGKSCSIRNRTLILATVVPGAPEFVAGRRLRPVPVGLADPGLLLRPAREGPAPDPKMSSST